MAFGQALSGIQVSNTELSVIGNNIANASTVGFKESRAEFADIYASTANNAVGAGAKVSSVGQAFSQGNVKFTSNDLDLAINGDGFFITEEPSGTRSYTRAGSFFLDKDGSIVNASGSQLVGLNANATGVLQQVSQPIAIDTSNSPPSPTTTVSTVVNVDSRLAAEDLTTTAWDGTGVQSQFNNLTSTTIFDSLGNPQTLSTYFIKSDQDALAPAGVADNAAPANTTQWYVAFQITRSDGTVLNVPADPAPGSANSQNLMAINFNQSGIPDATTPLTAPTGGNPTISGRDIQITGFDLGNGSAPLTFTINMIGDGSSGTATSTQFGSDFATLNTDQNGRSAGRLDGLEVDNSGIVLGRFTNGTTRQLGQVQLANFANVNGLRPSGETNWIDTSSSGQPIIGTPATASLGGLSSGSLEESNVDLTSALVALITAQRNFQANAQTIKTADTVTQTIINLR